MKFQELNIIPHILKAIESEGYEIPSPIQEQAIPLLLEGRDMLGSAQTGTGKTLAFAVPIIQGLYDPNKDFKAKREIKALVLAPTRELAEQIKESFRTYGKNIGLKTDVVYGGVSQKNQEIALKKGVDVLIATPGRLMDLMNQKLISLAHVEYLVLDEADRMLDMGFIQDVQKIVSYVPQKRQTMLFSATVPKEILNLANSLLKDPVRVQVTPEELMVDKIKQSLYFVAKKDKTNLLIDLLVNPKLSSVLVFTRTKHGANKLVKELLSFGVKADAIHGNKSQNNRQKALAEFKSGKIRVLVATDIAARGIDIDELSHVINYDLPETPETYIHRMGRTGRAGLSGEAFSFCNQEELHLLKQVEKHIKQTIPVVSNHLFEQKVSEPKTKTPSQKPKQTQSQKPKVQKQKQSKSQVKKDAQKFQKKEDKPFTLVMKSKIENKESLTQKENKPSKSLTQKPTQASYPKKKSNLTPLKYRYNRHDNTYLNPDEHLAAKRKVKSK